MLRGPVRRYGRTVVVDTHRDFDNIILEQAQDGARASPFCSSDSSHTSSRNYSTSQLLEHSSSRPVTTRQTKKNLRARKKQILSEPDGSYNMEVQHEQSSRSSHCTSLFHEESSNLVLCTPVKVKKQRNLLKERNAQPKTNNKTNAKQKTRVCREKNLANPAKDNYYECPENVPDFDAIEQDDLIIDTSTPRESQKCVAERLGHNASLFSPSSLNVSHISVCGNLDFNQSASSPGNNYANITFRRGRQPSKIKRELKKLKNKCSPDSGNLSGDYAESNPPELTDCSVLVIDSSHSSRDSSTDDSSSSSSNSITNSFNIMRLRSFDKLANISQNMPDREESLSTSGLTSSPVLLEGSSSLRSRMSQIAEEGSWCSVADLKDGELEKDDDDYQQEEGDDEEEGDHDEEDGYHDGVECEEYDCVEESEEISDSTEERQDESNRPTGVNKADITLYDLANSLSFIEKLSNSSLCQDVLVSARERVLSLCGQSQPISFTDCIPAKMMSRCVKIGEGVYGEVFRSFSQGNPVALKIIPIEGDQQVNECPQKKFDEILPEVVIAKELSDLTDSHTSRTNNFCQVQRISCVRGAFPSKLLEQWDVYSQEKVSENDRPDMFSSDQLFIVFEFVDGGCALENYPVKVSLWSQKCSLAYLTITRLVTPSPLKFSNHTQAFSVLRQVVFALAVAETELEFEHRDLHIGNVLVKSCSEETVMFKLQDKEYEFPTEGVTATIIDFTISRLKKDGCAVFCDISTDDGLFEGKGDFQFDVYRDMRTENGNDWQLFCPHSNVLWANYICKKLVSAIKYKEATRSYREIQRHLKTMVDHILDYSSCLFLTQDSMLWGGPC